MERISLHKLVSEKNFSNVSNDVKIVAVDIFGVKKDNYTYYGNESHKLSILMYIDVRQQYKKQLSTSDLNKGLFNPKRVAHLIGVPVKQFIENETNRSPDIFNSVEYEQKVKEIALQAYKRVKQEP